jgi:hypothetical protein
MVAISCACARLCQTVNGRLEGQCGRRYGNGSSDPCGNVMLALDQITKDPFNNPINSTYIIHVAIGEYNYSTLMEVTGSGHTVHIRGRVTDFDSTHPRSNGSKDNNDERVVMDISESKSFPFWDFSNGYWNITISNIDFINRHDRGRAAIVSRPSFRPPTFSLLSIYQFHNCHWYHMTTGAPLMEKVSGGVALHLEQLASVTITDCSFQDSYISGYESMVVFISIGLPLDNNTVAVFTPLQLQQQQQQQQQQYSGDYGDANVINVSFINGNGLNAKSTGVIITGASYVNLINVSVTNNMVVHDAPLRPWTFLNPVVLITDITARTNTSDKGSGIFVDSCSFINNRLKKIDEGTGQILSAALALLVNHIDHIIITRSFFQQNHVILSRKGWAFGGALVIVGTNATTIGATQIASWASDTVIIEFTEFRSNRVEGPLDAQSGATFIAMGLSTTLNHVHYINNSMSLSVETSISWHGAGITGICRIYAQQCSMNINSSVWRNNTILVKAFGRTQATTAGGVGRRSLARWLFC